MLNIFITCPFSHTFTMSHYELPKHLIIGSVGNVEDIKQNFFGIFLLSFLLHTLKGSKAALVSNICLKRTYCIWMQLQDGCWSTLEYDVIFLSEGRYDYILQILIYYCWTEAKTSCDENARLYSFVYTCKKLKTFFLACPFPFLSRICFAYKKWRKLLSYIIYRSVMKINLCHFQCKNSWYDSKQWF